MLKLKKENLSLAERVSKFGERMDSLAEHQQQMRPSEEKQQSSTTTSTITTPTPTTEQTDGTQKQGKKRQREQPTNTNDEIQQTQTQTQTHQKYSELDLQAITDDLLGLKSELLITKKALIQERTSFETLERESQTRILALEQRQKEIEALSTNTLSILEQGQILLNKQKEKLTNELKIVSKEMEISREKLQRLDSSIKSLTLLDPEELNTLKTLLENISISLEGGSTTTATTKQSNNDNNLNDLNNDEVQIETENETKQKREQPKNQNKQSKQNHNNNNAKQQKQAKKETQTQQKKETQTQTQAQKKEQTQEKIYEQLEEIEPDSQKRCAVCSKPSLNKCGKCQVK